MKLLPKLRFYLHSTNESPSNMSAIDAQGVPKEMTGGMAFPSLSPVQKKTTEAALLCASAASLLTIVHYIAITYLENSPCLDEKRLNISVHSISTSAHYPYTCRIQGVLWDIVASSLVFSASAMPVNVLLSLKWVQTSPHMLMLWILFIFMWVIDNVFATLAAITANFNDVKMIALVALPTFIIIILGVWTTHTAFQFYVEVEKLQEGIRMKHNTIKGNKCMELEKHEKFGDNRDEFLGVPFINHIGTYSVNI